MIAQNNVIEMANVVARKCRGWHTIITLTVDLQSDFQISFAQTTHGQWYNIEIAID